MVLTILKTSSTPSSKELTVDNGGKLTFSLKLADNALGMWALFFGEYPVIPLNAATNTAGSNTSGGVFTISEEEGSSFDIVFAVYPVGTNVAEEIDYSNADSYQSWHVTVSGGTTVDPLTISDYYPKTGAIDIDQNITFNVSLNKACSVVWTKNGATIKEQTLTLSNLKSECPVTFGVAGVFAVKATCVVGGDIATHTWDITIEDIAPTTDELKITPTQPTETVFEAGSTVNFALLTNNQCNVDWYKNNVLMKTSTGVTTSTFTTLFIDVGNNVVKAVANDGTWQKTFTWNMTITEQSTNDPDNDDNNNTLLYVAAAGVIGLTAFMTLSKRNGD